MAALGLGTSFYHVQSGHSPIDFLPSSLENLQIWLRNDIGLTSAIPTESVSRWNDSSGNDRYITQSTAGSQGTNADGGIRMNPSTTADFYSFESSTIIDLGGAQDWTLFVVMKRLGGATDPNTIFGGDHQDQHFRIATETDVFIQTTDDGGGVPAGQGAVSSKFVFPSGTWANEEKLFMTVSKGTDGTFSWYKNGVSVSGTQSGAANTTNIGQRFKVKHLGTRDDGSSPSDDDHMHGEILEFILYNAKLNAYELGNVHSYLHNYFKL
tara:strand:- start:462 stop:1262 length:801 start_codon:yes stop_codon:yes gene_type:complete